jgi:Ni/Fe-hydrogenase 1 B-type cytochrome subunit
MQVERWTGRVIGGPFEDVYVYEAPVRLWHWVTVLCMMVLAVTGYFIGSPPPAIGGEPVQSFLFGWIRTVHYSTAMILIVAFAVRIYWAFAGNHHARAMFVPPLWSGAWWRGLVGDMRSYLFLRSDDERWVGHNPLAQIGMFSMFTLGIIVLIFTGLGLYAQGYGWGSGWMRAFGWVTVLLGTPQAVRTVHHLTMWYVLLFSLIHLYMVFRQDIVGRSSIVSTMISGIRMFKGEPRR